MMEFEKVLKGIEKFIYKEMYNGFTEWQRFMAEIAVKRIVGRSDLLKEKLKSNSIIQMLDIMDEEGNVDVEGLMSDIRHKIEEMGKLSLTLPLFGTFTFCPSDVDVLHRYIINN